MARGIASKLKFAKDQFGKEVLQKEDGFPVMMEWEKPYVEACVDAIRPAGADILEVGFALGYAADRIQHHKPKSHTIIESDPTVIARAKEWAKKQKGEVKIIEGKWQDILSKLHKFDALYLNDYIPYEKEELSKLMKENEFIQDAASETHALAEALEENLKQWQGLKFSDEEIKAFGKQVVKRNGITMRDVLDFMDYLEEMGHISAKQKKEFTKEFQSQAEKKMIPQGAWTRQNPMLTKAFLGDRFLTFVETCLDWHMKPGARLSAYVGTPESKKHDKEFQERILSRKVNYTEKTIPVSVPENCNYYQSNKALVILLEKK